MLTPLLRFDSGRLLGPRRIDSRCPVDGGSDELVGVFRDSHQFCLAHLIRDAQYAIDAGDTVFAPGFKAFLKDACATGKRRADLSDTTIQAHAQRLGPEFDRLLALQQC